MTLNSRFYIGIVGIVTLMVAVFGVINLVVSGTHLQIPWSVLFLGWVMACAFICGFVAILHWATEP